MPKITVLPHPELAPEGAELHLRTDQLSVADSVQTILDKLEQAGLLKA